MQHSYNTWAYIIHSLVRCIKTSVARSSAHIYMHPYPAFYTWPFSCTHILRVIRGGHDERESFQVAKHISLILHVHVLSTETRCIRKQQKQWAPTLPFYIHIYIYVRSSLNEMTPLSRSLHLFPFFSQLFFYFFKKYISKQGISHFTLHTVIKEQSFIFLPLLS